MIGSGQIEEGVALLKAESAKAPADAVLRTTYLRERDLGLSRLATAAESARMAGDGKAAAELYQRAARLDENSPRVQSGRQALERDAARRNQLAAAEKLIAEKKYPAAQEIVTNPLQLLQDVIRWMQKELCVGRTERHARLLIRRLEEARDALSALQREAAKL